MMFYNGFNLLIDILLGSLIWFLTHRHYQDEYAKGMLETLEGIDDGSILHYYDQDGEKVWCIPCETGYMDICTGKDERYSITPAGLEALEAQRVHDLRD